MSYIDQYRKRIDSENGYYPETAEPTTEFANECCRENQNGQYCSCGTGGNAAPVKKKRARRISVAQKAPQSEITAAKRQVREKIRKVETPSPEQVQKARASMSKDIRSNTKDREARRNSLWEEFGGLEKGYVVCHITGAKMHKDKNNPLGLPQFTVGRILTTRQGGRYTEDNVIPELLQANIRRGDKPIVNINND